MKLRLLLCVLLYSNISFAQDIPNSGFEEWGMYNTWTLDPAAWDVQNFQLATNCYQDSMAFEGDFAMRVYPWDFFEPMPGVASISIPANAIPPSFNFAVKCFIDDELPEDSVSVMLQFFNTGNEEWIEVYRERWVSNASIPDWQEVTMELDQIEPVMDLCVISVIAGFGEFFGEGSPNTWISVDAMAFDQVNNVPVLDLGPEIVYDQANSTLRLPDEILKEGTVELMVFSVTGALVVSESNPNQVSTLELSSGIYIAIIETKNRTIEKKFCVQ